MSKIPYACLYSSYEGEMTLLEDAELGRLTRALMHYQNSGEELALSGPERYLWQRVKLQHDRDAEHYDEVCQTKSKNAKKRWEKLMHPHASVTKEKEKENEKEKEKEKEKECVCSTHDHTLFSPPDINDVFSFAKEEGLTAMDPQKFVDYYSAVGWVSGNRPIRDWKAAARMWNSKDAANAPKPVEEVVYGDIV